MTAVRRAMPQQAAAPCRGVGRSAVRPAWLDVAVNVVAAPVLVSGLAVHDLVYNAASPVSWSLAALTIWPLVARRLAPLVVFGVCLVALLGLYATASPPFAGVALLPALYTVAAHRPARVALPALGALELVVVLEALQQGPVGSVDDTIVVLSASAIAALFLGTTVRAQRRYLSSVEERAARLERERQQDAALAAAAERAAIAREMHDIVAHGLAVVITLADGAAVRVATDPSTAQAAMQQVSVAGRQSLGEMRRLLGVLRDDQDGSSSPQPRLAELDRLVEDVRATGLTVDLIRSGDLGGLDPTAQTALFRIVQEAVTNVLKHAVDASMIRIELRSDRSVVRFAVGDDGRAAARPVPGVGNGLIGMTERVGMFGGTVTAGPAGEGWTVQGTIRMEAVADDFGADR